MTIEETIRLLKALSDRSRLRIVNCLLDRPHYVEELAQRLDLAPSTVSFHMKRLEEARLVRPVKDQYYTTYHLHPGPLDQPLRRIVTLEDPTRSDQQERMERYRRKVIDTFLRRGKLTRIPVQRKKRRIILEELARRFEEGRRYTEKEVNLVIADWHDDFCTLRREMIAERLMERDKGLYWLAGTDQGTTR